MAAGLVDAVGALAARSVQSVPSSENMRAVLVATRSAMPCRVITTVSVDCRPKASVTVKSKVRVSDVPLTGWPGVNLACAVSLPPMGLPVALLVHDEPLIHRDE